MEEGMGSLLIDNMIHSKTAVKLFSFLDFGSFNF